MSQSSTVPELAPQVAAVLARFDRSSPEKLLASLATEILRLSQEQADLAARLQAVEHLQAAADRLLPAAEAGDLPQAVEIDATHAMLESSGFYPLEFDAAGAAYRWTGPAAQFSLNFFIDRRQGGRFSLSFARFAAKTSPSFMRCLLDGKPAEFTVHEQRGGYEISGVLPAREGGGASVLSFICPATASPAQLGVSADTRQLGLSFQKLVVRAGAETGEPARATKRAK